MKKRISGFFIAAILMAMVMPAQAAVLHIWACTAHDGKSAEDVQAVSAAWLKAAKSMDGGADLQVILTTPFAAEGDTGTFNFVVIAPSHGAYGTFNDGYEGSAAQKADAGFAGVAACSGSTIWESNPVE
jgi:hypothetical protein